jgi:mannose-1-phosphate guanylyltransferase
MAKKAAQGDIARVAQGHQHTGVREETEECRDEPGDRRILVDEQQAAERFAALPDISIDYALLEKADNVLMAAGDFAWDDLGTWTALARHLAPDADGNHAVADFLSVDSSGNIVFDARTKQRGLVATVGLNHCILVLTDDATLVLPRDRAQELKQLVAKLDQAGRKELL